MLINKLMTKEWNNHKQQHFIQMHMYGDDEKVVLKNPKSCRNVWTKNVNF